MTAKFNFIENLEKNYYSHPVVCYFCGKPLSFKKFYSQYETPKKFCSKKCKKLYIKETNDILNTEEEFSSQTEKAIHTFLTLQYPDYIIKHNLKDVYPPYEIDLCVETKEFPIYIEYNGTLHCTRKKKGTSKRIIQKRQLNDKIKKDELCQNRQLKLIRLWSEIGIYSKPLIFNEALKKLKEEIDILIKNNVGGGKCIEIIIDRNEEFHRYVEDFRN